MAAVSLTDIVKLYGRQLAVRGIDLEIPDRSFTVFVGPSGCGKSTTLRMIAGLESISHGTLAMDGERMNDTPSRDRGVAMVFQSYALYPHMSVRRNLEFSLKLEKLPKAEIAARVNEAAAVLELEPYLERKPQALSGGQRQRVAMGRAIVREPSVFLFDEPLSNLDAKLRNQMRVEIKRLQQRLNVTTIYVTHDQVEAMTLADNMVVMRDGLIEQTGTPLEIFERPVNRFVAGFIGSPQMNFLEGRVAVREGRPHLDTAGLSLPLDTERFSRDWAHGEELVAGLRPEAIVPVGHGLEPARALRIESEVEFTEMLGNETLIFARFGETDIVSRMAQPRPIAGGERIEMHVDLDRVHLFDGVSGASIRTPDASLHEERH